MPECNSLILILQSKIRALEDKLREEAHQRKLVQDKTAEVVSNYHYQKIYDTLRELCHDKVIFLVRGF